VPNAQNWQTAGESNAMTFTSGLAVVLFGLTTSVTLVASIMPTFSGVLSRLVADPGVTVMEGKSYGPHARHKLDIYRPAQACPNGPIVMFWYGGSWDSGDRATYAFAGAALAARGITTLVPDYRIYPDVQFPAFVDDAARAYAWAAASRDVAAMGAGSSPRPVFLMGHSAGAHIAALLAFNPSYLAGVANKPAGFIGLAGPYAFDPTTWASTKDIFATAPSSDAARPVSFVRRGAPPSQLLHGADDTTVKMFNLNDLATALRAVDTPVETAVYSGIGHVGLVLSLARPLRWRAPTLDAVVAFVDKHAGRTARCRASQ
jgi:acetyl esterase/lipase